MAMMRVLVLSSKSKPKSEAPPPSVPGASLFLAPSGAFVRGTF
jgi:hypothetical protein